MDLADKRYALACTDVEGCCVCAMIDKWTNVVSARQEPCVHSFTC